MYTTFSLCDLYIYIYKAYVIGKSNNKICFQFFEVEKRVALSLTSTNTTTFHAHVTKYNYNDKKNNDGNDCNGKRWNI